MILSQSFGDLAASCRDPLLRRAVVEIQQDLVSGRSLSSALARYPHLFPAHTVGAVWCGELSGTLDTALNEVASELEREANDERLGRLGWGLSKASIFLLVLALPLFDIRRIIAPLVGELGGSADIPASYGTAIASSALRDIFRYSLAPALGLLLAWIGWAWAKRVASVRRALDAAILYVPLWGRIHLFRSLSVFARFLNVLNTAGVGPDTAWNAASTATRNSEVVRRLRNAKARIGAHGSIADAAAATGLLESEDIAFIRAGENAGTVPESLARVATTYQQRSEALASVGRMWSTSFFISTQIAILGAGLVAVALSYRQALGMLGL